MGLLSFIANEEKVNTLQELEIAKGRIQLTIMKMIAFVLAAIMLSVIFIFMIGLFMPNHVIDNNEIFKIIGPAFSMIVGAFVGAFATMMGMKTADFDPNVKVQELGKTDYKELAEARTEEAKARSIEIDNEAKEQELINKYHESDEDHGPF
jgi:protein-S-isoprenylcysteine O-methyltransferase Ste14